MVSPNNIGVLSRDYDKGNPREFPLRDYMGVLIPQARMTHQEFLASKS